MKTHLSSILGAMVSFAILGPPLLPAQVTAFTYQGRLIDGGQPANGSYDFQFRLYDAASGGNQIPVIPVSPNVTVSNGLFTTGMDFGNNVFNGTVYWLEIAVQPHNGASFSTLSPRQEILPAPGAIFANSASNLLGTLPAAQLFGTIAGSSLPSSPIFPGAVTADSFSGSGANLTSLYAANISSGILADARLSANAALLNRDGQVFTGSNGFANVTVSPPAALSFGTATRQMLNLWGPQYGIGVQSYRLYFRTDNSFPGGGFAWFEGGSHNDGTDNPGASGAELMRLTSGGLTINGALTLTNSATINASANRILYADTNQNFYAGQDAGKSNSVGSFNTGVGYQALYSNKLSWNTALGYQALYANFNGYDNTAIGTFALSSHSSGFGNTGVGYGALYYNTSGNDNIGIGDEGGWLVTTGSDNIEIGNVGMSYDNNTIRIGTQGTQTNTIIAGILGSPVSGVPVVVNQFTAQLGVAPSSQRFKQNIQNMNDASDVLLALQPVTFQYKPGIDPQGIAQFGLIAEQVEKVDPDLVVHDKEHGIYTVRYEAVNAMLLNEFLKQHHQVEAQNEEIHALKEKLSKELKRKEGEDSEWKRQNETLEKRLNALEKIVFDQKSTQGE